MGRVEELLHSLPVVRSRSPRSVAGGCVVVSVNSMAGKDTTRRGPGKWEKFNLEMLITLAARAGHKVDLRVVA
jgi:hypothetical protein